MSAEEHKAVVRRFNEAVQQFFRTGDLAGFEEVVAPSLVHHGPGMPPDLAGLKHMLPAFRSAFPDVELTTEDLIAEGDRVVDRVTARGTHRGEFMGLPPTGRTFLIQELHIARIADGKIVERWSQFDMLGLLQQLGAIPAPEQARS